MSTRPPAWTRPDEAATRESQTPGPPLPESLWTCAVAPSRAIGTTVSRSGFTRPGPASWPYDVVVDHRPRDVRQRAAQRDRSGAAPGIGGGEPAPLGDQGPVDRETGPERRQRLELALQRLALGARVHQRPGRGAHRDEERRAEDGEQADLVPQQRQRRLSPERAWHAAIMLPRDG